MLSLASVKMDYFKIASYVPFVWTIRVTKLPKTVLLLW